jgi:hypothetical protein
VNGQIRYVGGSPPTSLQTPPAGPEDHCHFSTSVRFGRRKTDQVGQVALTTLWLQFRGRVDLSVSWAEVSDVRFSGRDIAISLHDSGRLLHFCCLSDDDAARTAAIASHLAGIAQSDPYESI